jgi:hypothetical protein
LAVALWFRNLRWLGRAIRGSGCLVARVRLGWLRWHDERLAVDARLVAHGVLAHDDVVLVPGDE